MTKDTAQPSLPDGKGQSEVSQTLDEAYQKYWQKEESFIQLLEALAPDMIVEQIGNEHPQTIALIVSTLNKSSQASKILKKLPEKLQANVAYRILNMKRIPPGVLSEIIDVFLKETKASGASIARNFGGGKSFNSILELAEENEGEEILANLKKHYPQSKAQLEAVDQA